MSDISQAVEQQEIADSILDAPLVASFPHTGNAPAQQEAPEPETQQDGTDADAFVEQEAARKAGAEFPGEKPEREQPEAQPQPQEQAQEQTPEQARESIQSQETFLRENKLIDATDTKELVFGMAESLGGSVSSFNVEELGSTSALVALSAARVEEALGQNFNQLAAQVFQGQSGPLVPAAMADEFTNRFLRSCNQEPRLWEGRIDKQLLADTVFFGDANIIHTLRSHPGVTNVSEINSSTDACLWAYGNFLRAFGQNVEEVYAANPQQFLGNAIRLADARASYLLPFVGKLGQIQPTQQRQVGQRGASRFKTNADLFDEDTLERLSLEKVGRRSGKTAGVRTPKKHTFTSNQDIFDEGAAEYEQVNGRL
jgi:hypothetical protein